MAVSWLQRGRNWLANKISPQRAERSFAAAAIGRLTSDWWTAATSADAEIRGAYRLLIDRSRSLERDNDYQRGFLLSCQRNINGSHHFDLRMDCGEWVSQRQAPPKWQPDKLANRLIEEAWTEWGKKGTCTADRKLNWRGVRRLAVRSVVRDGNFIARKIRGPAAQNRFGFRLQIWEIDHLCLEKSGVEKGREIKFGIEFDEERAPVAYWVRARHPGDLFGAYGADGGWREVRLPADEIYHCMIGDRAEQSIGYPWIVSAITRLRQLGAFEEAATIAARLGASKAAYFKKGGDGGPIGTWKGPTDACGRAMTNIEPAMIEDLPEGWDMGVVDWQYPNIETGEFRKAMLRGVSSGLGVSYTSVGNDLESVNFSSARVGLFDEREGWKDLQIFFSEDLWDEIFKDWLEASILAGAINLPLSKFSKFNRPVFKSRRWAMIDPAKEISALETALRLRVQSRRGFIEDQGGDVEETFHENKDDEDLAEEIGLELGPMDEPEAPKQPPKEDDEEGKPKSAPKND